MKIENIETCGWRAALRGMRNPMNSWDRADSQFQGVNIDGRTYDLEVPIIGPNDMERACALIKGGTEHRKFLRMIHIQYDQTFPIYGWSEFDTYKIAVTRNSCSTMHKLGSRDLTVEDFEENEVLPQVLEMLNALGSQYRQTKDFSLVRKMKAHLPASYLQKATIDMNYEVAMNMYFQRRNHRLPIWSGPTGVCAFIKSLPYMDGWLALKEEK